MSDSEVTVRLNPLSYDWYGARAAVEEELKAIGKALERIRISSQLQDAFTAHLLAVHRQWCETCPPTGEHGPPAGGLERVSCTKIHARAAAEASNPMKHKNSVSCVSAFTQTTDMNGHRLQINAQGEVDDNDISVGETSAPSSMTCRVENEESQADVNRTPEKPSTEKGVGTEFIKLEVLEDDQFQDTRVPVQLKLEKDHYDVDMNSSKEETPSQQMHEEEVPSQLIKSDGHSHLERTNKVSDDLIRHERDSQGHLDFDMAGSSSEAVSYQGSEDEILLDRSEGTNTTISALSCDVLSQEGVFQDPCLDSYNKVQKTSVTDDGANNSAVDCDVLSAKGISTGECTASLDSFKNVQKISNTDGKMKYQRLDLDCSISYSHINEYQKHLSTDTCQKPYQCSVCSKRFSSKKSLSTHACVMKHKGEKHFKCDHCSYQCNTKRTLNVHLRRHTRDMPYKCSFCDKIFYQKGDVERHMMIHDGEKPFKCDICDFRGSRKGHLTTHMKLHTGQKPHGCPICGKRFLRPSVLKRHMIVHTGQKPHHCSLCGKRFTQLCHLKRHMITHTGQMPHQCAVCGKRFTQLCHLKRHMITHTGQMPHQCSLCGKRFSRLDHFKKHKETH